MKIVRPHLYVKNINKVNWEYLKNKLGIRAVLFDKDDTLSIHHKTKLHPSISKSTIEKIVDLWKERIFLLSNDPN